MDPLAQALAARQSGLTSGGVMPQQHSALIQAMAGGKENNTLASALMGTPLRSFLEYQAADVPGKGRDLAQAIAGGYKKAIDNSLRLGPTVMSGTAPQEEIAPYVKNNLELTADIAGGGFGTSKLFNAVPEGSLGMNVYQGGPHKYGPEGAANSLDHMNKGEGAQAYGWGRYDAESKGVGQDYKRQLSKGKAEVYEDGKLIKDYDVTTLDDPRSVGLNLVEGMQRHRPHLSQDEIIDAAVRQGNEFIKYDPDNAAGWKSGIDWLAENRTRVTTEETGYLYKHDLPDEDIARYLDWDKPLSEQPDAARAYRELTASTPDEIAADKELLNQLYPDGVPTQPTGPWNYASRNTDADITGQQAYSHLEGKLGKQAASEALGELGIPGLKYHDGMSRIDGPAQQLIEGQGSREAALELAQTRLKSANDDFGLQAQTDRKYWGDMVDKLDKPQTRNFVTWDQDVLNRMKLLERNGEVLGP
jgi:hypothetical protein